MYYVIVTEYYVTVTTLLHAKQTQTAVSKPRSLDMELM